MYLYSKKLQSILRNKDKSQQRHSFDRREGKFRPGKELDLGQTLECFDRYILMFALALF